MSTAITTFQKAVKYGAKGRVALAGPAGSGKSYTMLVLARLLAGPNGKIAAIDTEHGSLSKYADLFDFDVIELDSFSPDIFVSTLKQAEAAKYDVFCCDSLSHFWMGKDGALEFVDMATKKSSSRDGMAGWKDFRPHERRMVDLMIASPCHIICTMRTKTDYQEVEVNGKKKRVKIGLAPVQREGFEYEFDLTGYLDDENNLVVDKTRCPALNGKVFTKPTGDDLVVFRDWLKGTARAEQPATPQAPLPATPARASTPSSWMYEGGLLLCQPLAVEPRHSSKGKPFIAVKLNGECEGKRTASCWHASLADALKASVGMETQFRIEVDNGYPVIADVIEIDGVKYKDGLPQRGPGVGVADDGTLITDDDLPF